MEKELKCFKALSDKNRLRVVLALCHYSDICACQLTELLGVTGATASRHMGLLLDTNLITSRKEGRWVFYSLTTEGKEHPAVLWAQKNLQDDAQIVADNLALEEILAENPEDLCRKQRGEACCPIKKRG